MDGGACARRTQGGDFSSDMCLRLAPLRLLIRKISLLLYAICVHIQQSCVFTMKCCYGLDLTTQANTWNEFVQFSRKTKRGRNII